MKINDRFGARQFLYSDRAAGRPMIGSVPEEICDLDQGAGPRTGKTGLRTCAEWPGDPAGIERPGALGAANLGVGGPVLNRSTLL
ncbi:hypothetical protein [Azospirillum argentinense]